MASSASRWKSPPASAADDEDGGASSISDVFVDMLTVNEDMIVAAAECQAEQDVEGLIAYQRILHRDLMEMAEFIDSMFGVYGNGNCTSSSLVAASSRVRVFQTKSDEPEQSAVVGLITASADGEASTTTEEKVDEPKKRLAEKAPRGALLKAIEDGEKERETQRSKEQWVKSRHQVLEEEGVSAIMKENTNGMLEVPRAKPGANAEEEGHGGLALANQLRAHQHIAAFVKATTEAAAGPPPPTAPMNLLLANPLAVSTMTPVPGSFPPPPPLPMAITATGDLRIKPNTAGSTKVALPPAHMYSMYMPFAPLMFNPHAAGGFMPMPTWQPPMQAALPARPTVSVRPPAQTPEFKRMCESCRKRHLSVRQCRLVLQHTDPEWQPAQSVPSKRRRRKQSATEQVT
ncbi:hypothetical protein PRNP1_003504 [Phytophthora ramorum]